MKKKINYNLLLLFLMMTDYLYTYIGIVKVGFIEEGNPLLVWLFDLPFIYGLIIRFLYSALMCGFLQYACSSGYKHYPKVIFSMISVNVVILVMHLNWIKLLLFELVS